jgi:hypothetical protein
MKKSHVLVAIALMCLSVMGRVAQAQQQDVVVAQVPFDFVVGTTTMPAGSYRVGRLSVDAHSALLISNHNNNTMVLPIFVDDSSDVQAAQLNFAHVGDKYILTQVETPDHLYTIAKPRARTMLVHIPDRGNATSGGTK